MKCKFCSNTNTKEIFIPGIDDIPSKTVYLCKDHQKGFNAWKKNGGK